MKSHANIALMNIAKEMESSEGRVEKQMPRWRRMVKQLRHDLLTRFSRALRKRWAEFHFLPVRITLIDNPAYRGASADKYKLVKLAEESDAGMYMYTADEEGKKKEATSSSGR